MTLLRHPSFQFVFDPGECQACGGKCCRGESGHVFITRNELKRIADHLSLTTDAFISEYLVKAGYKYSIGENTEQDGGACLLLDRETGKCRIYSVRPRQCRIFPFWDEFIDEKQPDVPCPGIKPLEF